MLAPLEGQLRLCLACCAFEAQDDLLGSLRFFVKDGLRLTAVTRLLAIVTAFTLGEERSFAGLVLRDFVF